MLPIEKRTYLTLQVSGKTRVLRMTRLTLRAADPYQGLPYFESRKRSD